MKYLKSINGFFAKFLILIGHIDAEKLLSLLQEVMSTEEIAKAKNLARNSMSQNYRGR